MNFVADDHNSTMQTMKQNG